MRIPGQLSAKINTYSLRYEWHTIDAPGLKGIAEAWRKTDDAVDIPEVKANAALIVALRNALPSLLDRIEEVERERDEALEAHERYCKDWDIRKCLSDAVAARDRLAEALRDCVDDLEAEINARRETELPRRIDRDMETVREARAALAALETPDAGWSL